MHSIEPKCSLISLVWNKIDQVEKKIQGTKAIHFVAKTALELVGASFTMIGIIGGFGLISVSNPEFMRKDQSSLEVPASKRVATIVRPISKEAKRTALSSARAGAPDVAKAGVPGVARAGAPGVTSALGKDEAGLSAFSKFLGQSKFEIRNLYWSKDLSPEDREQLKNELFNEIDKKAKHLNQNNANREEVNSLRENFVRFAKVLASLETVSDTSS